MVNGNTNIRNAGEERKSPGAKAFENLSRRERALILTLIVIGVVCALYFFVVQPGFDRLSALEAETASAEETQDEYVAAIAAGPAFAEQAAAATAAYDEARAHIFSPLSIEELDATVTGYLESAGFDPEALTMSPLQPEDMTPFSPQPLSEPPDEQPVSEYTETPQAMIEDAADPDEAVADPDAPLDGSKQTGGQAGGAAYSYSANISAAGGWNELYKLLDIVAATDGVELTHYSYSESGGEDSGKGSFAMTIKFYVFIEGAITETGEAPAE
jgi:hypothetical protein